ncbi:MAG: MerR family transcriptional regulator [Clostridiaceae bacterium]
MNERKPRKIRYYTIGELGKILEINSETIRYYEKINLIPKPTKFENGYKKYSESYIYRLKLIKKAKLFGFTLKEITNFFSDVLNKGDEELDLTDVVSNKIDEIEEKITKLSQKKELLVKFEDEMKELSCPVLTKIINENKKSS